MTTQELILEDLKESQRGDKVVRDSLKVIVSEFQRQKSKNLSEGEVVSILKKLKKWAEDELFYTGNTSSVYLDTIERYIPQQESEEQIRKWIEENIDFSQYKNKMQAMKQIMFHFGVTVNGNTVKSILNNM